MLTKAPKTITKTTMKLMPGDNILTGDMFDGFDSYKILKVEESEFNKRYGVLTIQFSHGGITVVVHAKHTRWAVIA